MQPIIDHIDITVNDLTEAEKFYDKVLPLLGFDLKEQRHAFEEADDYRSIEYPHKNFLFSIVQAAAKFQNDTTDYRSSGALHHLAFKAESKAAVDIFYNGLLNAGIAATPPALYPQYYPDYYAVFFDDPFGIRYELVFYSRK
ncbi:MAG: VOC family protein [Clostridiales bacterium]|jgi:catechol 2,3-dioxygenase-like lactoylglutathione lyase family enzyme|nr:VOC family protein [Clostridiales bacterium]